MIQRNQSQVALLKLLVASVFLAGRLLGALADEPPDDAQQQRMIQNIRQSAARYLDSLPNFVCLRTTERNEGNKNAEHWRRRDTITERVVFNQSKETISLEAIDGKPIQPGHVVDLGFTTEGELGAYIKMVLDANSHAQIQWSHWETLDRRTLAVFQYSVDAEHSLLGIDDITKLPYGGLLYADPESGELWRVSSKAENISSSNGTEWLTTMIEYGWVTIDNRQYRLPVKADARLGERKKVYWNKISFTDYRKFAAESKITFVPGSN